MAAGGFGPYHCLWADGALSKGINVTPTSGVNVDALRFTPYHCWRELWRTPPQQRICRFNFLGEKNRPETI